MDLAGKRVLLRAGFDVPIEHGSVTNTERIDALVPTMKAILDRGGALILLAHQGRPKGEGYEEEFSQKPLIPVLEERLGVPIQFGKADDLSSGQVLLLENLRFDAREKKNDVSFARELAALGDVYVNDAFPNCHRAHASMVVLPTLLPSCMGLALEQEVQHLSMVNDHPRRPLILIVSGAKMETKVPVIERFLTIGDAILTGGGIANTFLAAQGMDIGNSLYDKEYLETARALLTKSARGEGASIHLPVDAIVSESAEGTMTDISLQDHADAQAIFDIGPKTASQYAENIKGAGTVIWNGPLGMYERPECAEGSRAVAAALAQSDAYSVVGGGDTIDFHHRYGCPMDTYTFVSTGGGAMLEFLAGKPLPALEALQETVVQAE